MKKFEDLTEIELCELSDEQVEWYVKLQCVKNGIKLMDKPTPPKLESVPKENEVVFIIGVLGNSIVFKKSEDAQEVIDLLKRMDVKRIVGEHHSPVVNYIQEVSVMGHGIDRFDIYSKHVYSESKYKEIKEIYNLNSKLGKDFDYKSREYSEYMFNTKEIRDKIYETVNSAKEKYNMMDNWCRLFKKDYLPLADDNVDLAMRFLTKAYRLSNEAKNYVLVNYKLF